MATSQPIASARSARHFIGLTIIGLAALMAVHFASRRHFRMGVAILLQVKTGMRPGELLRLTPEDFLFPEDQGLWDETTPLVIVLGARSGTKSQRAQVTMLAPGDTALWYILRAMRNATQPNCYMLPYTMLHYRREIKLVDTGLGLNLGFSPHSARAGYATDMQLQGVPFNQIKEGGRWLSDSSLRVYLDVLGATQAPRLMRLKGLAPQLAAADRWWPSYFGVHCAGSPRVVGAQ